MYYFYKYVFFCTIVNVIAIFTIEFLLYWNFYYGIKNKIKAKIFNSGFININQIII